MSLRLFILFLFSGLFTLTSQASVSWTLSDSTEVKKEYKGKPILIELIEVSGNAKTKDFVIFREMEFAVGDSMSVPDFLLRMEQSEKNIRNTQLFLEVSVFLTKLSNDRAQITVYVRERFYHAPVPVFKLVDRNFNVWLQDYNLDFSRITYGITYKAMNIRGRNETLTLGFNLGFNQTIHASYDIPFIGKRPLGLLTYFKADRTKSIAVATVDDKLEFLSDDDFVRTYFQFGAVSNYRQSLYNTHFLGLQYMHTKVADTILLENPLYLQSGQTKQDFFQFSYRFQRDRRDRIVYPTTGNFWSFEFEKLGLGIFNDINFFNLYGNYIQYFDPGANFFLSSQFRFKTSAPNDQPYFNQQGLGYRENFVRGYELYVVDGQHYGLFKLNIKNRLLSYKMQSSKFLNDNRYEGLPFEFYLKAHFDAGYVVDNYHNAFNNLSNSWLLGGGVGLDLVLPYNLVLRLEYSAIRYFDGDRSYLENGLYLHFNIALQDFMQVKNRIYP